MQLDYREFDDGRIVVYFGSMDQYSYWNDDLDFLFSKLTPMRNRVTGELVDYCGVFKAFFNEFLYSNNVNKLDGSFVLVPQSGILVDADTKFTFRLGDSKELEARFEVWDDAQINFYVGPLRNKTQKEKDDFYFDELEKLHLKIKGFWIQQEYPECDNKTAHMIAHRLGWLVGSNELTKFLGQ